MTTKCVNPACCVPFRYLRGGRLFLVDRPGDASVGDDASAMTDGSRVSEFFYLCEVCCKTMQVILDKGGAVVLQGFDRRPVTPHQSPEAGDSTQSLIA
jgi:hypothetical protein